MKKLFIFLLIIPAFAFSQTMSNDTLYTSTGVAIVKGQKLKIGTGTLPDGSFKYIRITVSSIYHGSTTSSNALKSYASGYQYPVIKIEKRGNENIGFVYYPIVKGAFKYEVDIENAIKSGEIVFKK